MPNTFTQGNRHIALWGGGFPRTTGASGKWLCIPTGHMQAYLSMGTSVGAPDTSYNPSLTADDLGVIIWNAPSTIVVTKCRIWYAQGASVNTTHALCLMRYDIDADGTLSNGAEVAGPDTDAGSDDYTTLAHTDLTMTTDTEIGEDQVLIAMIYCIDAINAAITGKCVIEYTM